jgi:hypothetical protein
MKKIILPALLAISIFSKAQNLPACDSLVIACCTFDSLGVNTITIYADNHSSVLFDYPGFVLFNAAMDTIAKETVQYFGIGTGFQPHTMDIVAPLVLPFSGKLNLYTGFHTFLACSFPYQIADTATGVLEHDGMNRVEVYPNPAVSSVTITLPGFTAEQDLEVAVCDVTGREVLRTKFDLSPMKVELKGLSEGMYVLKIIDAQDEVKVSRKVIVGPH